MAEYELTMLFPDVPFDSVSTFLTGLVSRRTIQGVRRHGAGVAVIVVVETKRGRGAAERTARQRIAGILPREVPELIVEELRA